MTDTFILFISVVLFGGAQELIRRSAMRHILESDDADESCHYRKRFYWLRLGITIVFVGIALYVIFSGPNIGVNAVMAGLMSAWSSYINKHSLPLSGKRPADITKPGFVLYLRGFASDDYSLSHKDLSKKMKNPAVFSEGHFISILKQYMPTYAVGMTKELDSPIGAERIYLDDAGWKEEVMDLMTRASLIVILLNDTRSCIWEICKAKQFKDKVVFISNNSEKLTNVRKELNRQYLYHLPIGLKDKTISYTTVKTKEAQIIEYANTEKSYRNIIKQLMSEKFGLRRFVFTQKRLTLILCIYGVLFLAGWSILAIKCNLDDRTAIVLGVFSYVASAILLLFTYDKFYMLKYRKFFSSQAPA